MICKKQKCPYEAMDGSSYCPTHFFEMMKPGKASECDFDIRCEKKHKNFSKTKSIFQLHNPSKSYRFLLTKITKTNKFW